MISSSLKAKLMPLYYITSRYTFFNTKNPTIWGQNVCLPLKFLYFNRNNQFYLTAFGEIRLRLGNAQINLAFRSPYTNFALSKQYI